MLSAHDLSFSAAWFTSSLLELEGGGGGGSSWRGQELEEVEEGEELGELEVELEVEVEKSAGVGGGVWVGVGGVAVGFGRGGIWGVGELEVGAWRWRRTWLTSSLRNDSRSICQTCGLQNGASGS